MTPEQYGLTKVAYSIREAANALSVGRTAIYELIRAGELKPVNPGKKNLIFAVELAALLDKWRALPAKQHVVRRREQTDIEKGLKELGL